MPTILFVASSEEENCENSTKWKGRDNWMDLARKNLKQNKLYCFDDLGDNDS